MATLNKAVTATTGREAIDKIGNHYDVILIAAARAREINQGSKAMVVGRNGPVVTALKEIEAGLVGRDYLNKLR